MGDDEGKGEGRVGVFGGTFDPVHVGHLIVAMELRHALKLDRLIFVPAGRPPHKTAQDIVDDTDRVAMLRLAIAETPELELSTLDLDHGALSYTADLLVRLQQQLSAARLFFLMGNDSLRDFPNWFEPDRIVSLAELGVAARLGAPVDLAALEATVPATRGRVHLVETPLIGVASRDIRRRVRRNEPIRFQVPPSVERYIRSRGLYRKSGRKPAITAHQPEPIGQD